MVSTRILQYLLFSLVVVIGLCAVTTGFLLTPIPFTTLPIRGAIVALVFLFAGKALEPFVVAHKRAEVELAEITNPPDQKRPGLGTIYLATIRSLVTAIDAKANRSPEQVQRVQQCAVAIAGQMQLDSDTLESIQASALLHDIGKLAVPDYILLKTGPLSPEELEKMRRHPVIGAAILEAIPFPWPIADIVRHHHERWDGTGYPDNLVGPEIPQGARILAVAETYAALTSDLSYRAACTVDAARRLIEQGSGTQFDPCVVTAFLQVIGQENTQTALDTVDQATEDTPEQRAAYHIRHASAELWALYQISQALNTTLDIKQKFELLSDRIVALLPGSICGFVIFQPHTTALWSTQDIDCAEHQTGYPAEIWLWSASERTMHQGAHAFSSDSLLLQVARSRRLYTGAYREEGLFAELVPPPAQTVIKSSLLLPLTHLGQVLGILQVVHPDAHAFSDDDARLLALIAGHIEATLYQDILFDRTRSDALTDSLTGLYNARYLSQAIRPLLHRPPQSEPIVPFTVLYLDLDNFKPINDYFGHQQGNTVLQTVAALFQRELRPHDLVIRHGGDEFLIVLPHTDTEAATYVVERIRTAVKECRLGLYHPNQGDMRLDVSIGAACYPHDGITLDALIAVADERMYAQKATQKRSRIAAS